MDLRLTGVTSAAESQGGPEAGVCGPPKGPQCGFRAGMIIPLIWCRSLVRLSPGSQEMDLADTERRRATANPAVTLHGRGRLPQRGRVRADPPICCPGAGGKQLHPSPTTGFWLLLASALSALRSLLSHVGGRRRFCRWDERGRANELVSGRIRIGLK
ncbi:unnamed protein product [Arctogadus glacialis]